MTRFAILPSIQCYGYTFEEFLTYPVRSMASRGAVSKWMSTVSDDELVSLLESQTDIDLRLCALKELLRDAETVEDIREYENEIKRTIKIFYIILKKHTMSEDVGGNQFLLTCFVDALGLKNTGVQNPKSQPSRQWNWPIIQQIPGDGMFNADGFRSESALKVFGYTVGKTNGWPEQKRQRFLSDFIELELPEIVERIFDDEYGDPMTTTRLRKVANVIANNCGLRYRSNHNLYRHAIRDWESDLDFLKKKYYEGRGLKFHPWPESDPR